MQSAPEKRAVVSSFIFRFPRGKSSSPEVALLKRSDKVRTYQHHLAPISGSIERTDQDPLTAAWREIHEETTLTPQTLTHWRTGKPFRFTDPSVNREWTINPFAFTLAHPEDESAIHIDWEHESWHWYDPQVVLDQIDTLNGVPRLTDSLRRVWMEGVIGGHTNAGGILAAGLEQLQNDHASGSHELTTIAVRIFRDIVARMEGDTSQTNMEEEWWPRVRMSAWHLIKNGRESMGAATQGALLAILSQIEPILRDGQKEKTPRILAAIDSHLEQRSAPTTQLRDSLTAYLQKTFSSARDGKLTVLTTSNSSTIRNNLLSAFNALALHTLEVRILESRPLFEGATLASSLREQFQNLPPKKDSKLHIQLYTDASAAVAAHDVDVVILGADQISATKGVSNKTGSLPLVLSAKHMSPGVQIAVISGAEKINGTGSVVGDNHSEDNDAKELTETWARDDVKGTQTLSSENSGDDGVTIKVRNTYFEWVPLTLVDAFVCEEGVLGKKEIQRKAQQLGDLSDRYFNDL